MAKVIFLHGTSSSGKTSLAFELQKLHSTPYLHVGIDWFYDSFPPHFLGSTAIAHPGIFYHMSSEGRVVQVIPGEFALRMRDATIPAIKALLDVGNNLIIDEILFDQEGRACLLPEYASLFQGHTAYFIKVFCPLETLEKREESRPNRHRGIARLQYSVIHEHGFFYDYIINTEKATPGEGAREIVSFMQAHIFPQAFTSIYESDVSFEGKGCF